MTKKPSASSQPAKPVRRTEGDIRAYAKTPEFRAEMKRLRAKPDAEIDYSDLPQLTDEQLASMVRGRLLGMFRPVKQAVHVRLDSDVIAWLKSKGDGYQTRMNDVLRKAMLSEAEPAKPRQRSRA